MSFSRSKASRRLALGCAGAVAAVAVARIADAHHSFAMYDQEKKVTLTGKLTRFIPGANHAQLLFEVIDADGKSLLDAAGKPVIWGVETGPAAAIAERGITVASFPNGTILTTTLYPLRNGKTFGSLARGAAIIKCGNSLPKDGCNEKTGESFLEQRDGN
jgi:hypothetical protein